MIRKHDKPLQQIIRRCNEKKFIEKKYMNKI
jgi:GTP cyclohydrolase FolE2